ncbi:WYL domain-containing protein [Simiduia sp. 21SJ11W-1]|uniref:helix-turn-helix transcriptional regulator n=1 Tax=Simiduia sp. 21SJ11W-1 TaxID=2909669 RepID=UPI00209EDE52|nr:WYL domain-containing protein [Simiduia sp. 21SJ11W-1]UTA47070.1 WYL domain-containing protein [Simiduia sp. 21SJ11W-1]
MTDTWAIRWDLLARYRLIEIIALWEGRLTTNHLCDTFGMGRQQASKDINTYLKDIGPGNLVLDRSIKGYVPTPTFSPQVTKGVADEYLQLMARNNDLSLRFENLPLNVANTEVLSLPIRNVEPRVIRTLVRAAREQKRVEVDYVSVHNPNREGRIIAPHTLVFTGIRWHVRAWCEKNQGFRDFVLSRFRGEPELLDMSPKQADDDTAWNTQVPIEITPDTRLTPDKQAVVAADYGMEDNRHRFTVRGPLVHYALKLLQIDYKTMEPTPEAQQIVLANREALKPWLFD